MSQQTGWGLPSRLQLNKKYCWGNYHHSIDNTSLFQYLKNGKVLTGGKIRTLNDVLDEEVLLARQRMNGYPNFPSDDDLEGMKHLLPAGCSSESFMDELRNTYSIKK